MLCFFILCDDLLCQSFFFFHELKKNSCVFQIVHGINLFQFFFVFKNVCFVYFIFINFSGVGDLFFSLYSVSFILRSLFNSFVIHGLLFLYLIFAFSSGKLK